MCDNRLLCYDLSASTLASNVYVHCNTFKLRETPKAIDTKLQKRFCNGSDWN